ncbi:MAG TPA: hypothetical protein VFD60_01950, partial [Nitrososphaeraceae archaeon]|nr:hypothetical protein [Nitrososphaeraceae archaeon]
MDILDVKFFTSKMLHLEKRTKNIKYLLLYRITMRRNLIFASIGGGGAVIVVLFLLFSVFAV